MKSKEKGDIAVAQAISHYTKLSSQVLIPLGDRQKYDLVIDGPDGFKKVQCKYTSCRYQNDETKPFLVELRTKGGNKSRENVYHYSDKDFDLLFVMTADGNMYEVPRSEIGRCQCLLGKSYEKYLL